MKNFILKTLVFMLIYSNICLAMEEYHRHRPTPLRPINQEDSLQKEIEQFEIMFNAGLNKLFTELKHEIIENGTSHIDENGLKFWVLMKIKQTFENFINQSGLSPQSKAKIKEREPEALKEIQARFIPDIMQILEKQNERPKSIAKRPRR